MSATRVLMLLSGSLPWFLLLTMPSIFIGAMEWQIGLAVLFGSYVLLGLAWAAMEKEAALKYSVEAPLHSIVRAFLLLMILAIVPLMTKIGSGVAESITKQITEAIRDRRTMPGFVSVVQIWPTLWAIVCAYSLKPIWDVAVDSVRGKVIAGRLNLGPYQKKVASK